MSRNPEAYARKSEKPGGMQASAMIRGPAWLQIMALIVMVDGMGAVRCLSGEPNGGSPHPPNVLFIIADDASRHFGASSGCDWVKTPR